MESLPPELIHLIALASPRTWRQLLALPPFARHVSNKPMQNEAKRKFVFVDRWCYDCNGTLYVRCTRKILDRSVCFDGLPAKETEETAPSVQLPWISLPRGSPFKEARDSLCAANYALVPTQIKIRKEIDWPKAQFIFSGWAAFVMFLLRIYNQASTAETKFRKIVQEYEEYKARFVYWRRDNSSLSYGYKNIAKEKKTSRKTIWLVKKENNIYILKYFVGYDTIFRITFTSPEVLFR